MHGDWCTSQLSSHSRQHMASGWRSTMQACAAAVAAVATSAAAAAVAAVAGKIWSRISSRCHLLPARCTHVLGDCLGYTGSREAVLHSMHSHHSAAPPLQESRVSFTSCPQLAGPAGGAPTTGRGCSMPRAHVAKTARQTEGWHVLRLLFLCSMLRDSTNHEGATARDNC